MLFGAFAIGGVIHGVAVEGTMAPFSPIAVGGIVLGGVLVAVGVRLERAFDPSDYVADDDEHGEDDDEDAFDEEFSPISGEMLEDRESDEEYKEYEDS